ncbi:Enhancing lycopene biosynthesis protein 2 [Candidatus Electrothrix marina]|uniref:Enhancing lycopene biosynthesis protein 2 n=1 Tax=Candidatus Electrothrix marina TaxID=1859130 RepID=A0A3S4TC90_9BACT|nr:Enhancing lycopene biosynthesis protein 2 [Candidatus Electrothrix marina]RWX50418.1 Enhancing lycopene biosynthesis protein 2 [Candidatus Electrothrix marina]
MSKKQIAVILSGCGHQDGAEIHEATFTLWAIHKNGADYRCFAPNIMQHHVLNHITGQEMDEQRNVLIEAARIARGKIEDLARFDAAAVDALVIPGGVGAAKNLCTYAFDGPKCRVNKDVEQAVKAMHQAGKPIGALCIAPVLLARILGDITLTIGQDAKTEEHLRLLGASHQSTLHGEITVDQENKIVSTPCYMLDSRVDQIADGADALIQALLRFL